MASIRKTLKRLVAAPISGRRRVREERIDDLSEITRWLYWGSKNETLRFLLPARILRMHGAFAYSGGVHPFLKAIEGGSVPLAAFYAAHRPKDVAEAHWVDGPTPGAGPSDLPWIGRERSRAFSGEHGLGAEHGSSLFGPCSAEKVALEVRRLARLGRSVAEDGYNPDRFGDIHGTFLRMGDEYRFFVRRGNHRAAVLAAQGWDHIPVTLTEDWPRVIDAGDAANWPLVRQRRIGVEAARAIFASYFLLDGTEQYRWLGLPVAVKVPAADRAL